MDTNIALAGLASGMAVLVGAEYGRGVHDTPPGYAWQHCHEKYVWTPVCFTTSPHHGLVQSYLITLTCYKLMEWTHPCTPNLVEVTMVVEATTIFTRSRGYAAARTRSRAGDASCRPWRMRRRLSCRHVHPCSSRSRSTIRYATRHNAI